MSQKITTTTEPLFRIPAAHVLALSKFTEAVDRFRFICVAASKAYAACNYATACSEDIKVLVPPPEGMVYIFSLNTTLKKALSNKSAETLEVSYLPPSFCVFEVSSSTGVISRMVHDAEGLASEGQRFCYATPFFDFDSLRLQLEEKRGEGRSDFSLGDTVRKMLAALPFFKVVFSPGGSKESPVYFSVPKSRFFGYVMPVT